LNIQHETINMDYVCLSLVHFKGRSDTDPPKKKKKCKKKHLKDKDTDHKTPKPQQKPSPSSAAPKSPTAVKPNASKTNQSVNGGTTHTPKGAVSGCKFSNDLISGCRFP